MPASEWMSFNQKGRGLFIRFSPAVVGGHDSGLYSPLARVIPAEAGIQLDPGLRRGDGDWVEGR